MSTTFHHHPDGHVQISGPAGTYSAEIVDFAADLAAEGLPAYDGLPAGMRERRYGLDADTSQERHSVHTADSQIGGDVPWAFGRLVAEHLGALLAKKEERERAPAPTLDERKAAKRREINAAFERAAAVLLAGYPTAEMLTWPIQEQETSAWQANSATSTPYIDALALERGISRVDYLNRTAAKIGEFRAASTTLVGRRKKYQDQVDAAELAGDAAAIDLIVPIFT